MNFVTKLDRWIDYLATKLLVVSVLSMLLFSVSNIVLRWFNAHVMWIEPMVRYLVVLAAFLGGTIATGRRSHIAIDVIGKYLETKNKVQAQLNVRRITDIISFVALGFLTYACVGFVKEETQYGKIVFLGIHAKYLAMILPLGFGLMMTRFVLGFMQTFIKSSQDGEL
jgi:TRAP-type C4-dicarboxylate transport system permease small subunit